MKNWIYSQRKKKFEFEFIIRNIWKLYFANPRRVFNEKYIIYSIL